ncbi:MAG TPA: Fic family protein [Syntrophales bacterium]|nr:Fic family protein [Syntrophales bacterium]HQN77438.1 Fic family protein [Syntrophales bacterium]
MGRSGGYIKQITGYRAFIPSPLPPDPPLRIGGEVQKLLSRADMALARLDGVGHVLPDVNLFIAMYVKKEALLSSQIEGTQASLQDLFVYEDGNTVSNVNDVSDVVNYVKALNHGMKRLNDLPMSLRLIREIHEILIEGVRGGERRPGEFKKTQNWIGPPGCTLKDAVFIPPPPHETVEAMGKLEHYIRRDEALPVLIDSALIHYQFETIHPFLDGNGRLGRLLITFYLLWKKVLSRPLLYLSYHFKRNRQEYYDRLQMVRDKGDYEQWIAFFLKGVAETADAAMETAKRILELQSRHRRLLWENRISSPIAVGLLDRLFGKPYVSVKDMAEGFEISFQAASTIVSQFEKAGILKETTGRKRDKRYLYQEYMDILSEGTQG